MLFVVGEIEIGSIYPILLSPIDTSFHLGLYSYVCDSATINSGLALLLSRTDFKFRCKIRFRAGVYPYGFDIGSW